MRTSTGGTGRTMRIVRREGGTVAPDGGPLTKAWPGSQTPCQSCPALPPDAGQHHPRSQLMDELCYRDPANSGEETLYGHG